ncbi:16S rRNA (guanine(527)-N(7))-methyltransferase RsmG [Plantactinospora sp. GCM10030261]|uniref:16S rRNA (guanine(527)-N(7))-methyltransferase RsmG n=1 Tax=Plantactinospora sp. GCM10030261 TaxID=3273420 RepID=UPI00361B6A7F
MIDDTGDGSGPGGSPPGPERVPPESDDTDGPSAEAAAGVRRAATTQPPDLAGSAGDAGSGVPVPPGSADAATALFGARLPLAVAYAELLATDGVVRGLIGPRETPRLWERHLLNCAALAELIPAGRLVVDVGSGAGLPGLVLAIARPDLDIALVEPLARRTAFLDEAVAALGLAGSVTVVRGRAEEIPGAGYPPADIVTARAVAPLDKLARWCLPLVDIGGRLLAMKGASAAGEVAEHRGAVHRLGGDDPVVRQCGVDLLDPPTTVIDIRRERAAGGARSARGGRS